MDREKQDEKDSAMAEALRIAERYYIKMGWRYSAQDVGSYARRIMEGLTGGSSHE